MLGIKVRIDRLRKKMVENNIEALLVTHRPNVRYLSGFTGSSGFLLVTLQDTLLFTDFRYVQQGKEEAPLFEIVRIQNSLDFAFLVDFIAQKGLGTLALEEANFSLKEYNCLQNFLGDIQPIYIFNFVEQIRAFKDKEEIDFIAEAARIADEALKETLPYLKVGVQERDVALELEYRLRRGGSEKTPFEIIVASGPRSSLPHGTASSKVINRGDLVVIDFGAVYGGYSSDITRTFIMGAPDRKQEEIYNIVLEGQEIALNNLETGKSCAAIDALVRNYFKQNGYGTFFGHGLGHGVGLEVHELPVLSPAGKQVLEEGMVFTVEPGIYMEGWGGVRIEDLVVLDPSGPHILTKTPKELISL
ncbi:MAG: M24 family metallopeptidase [Dethiobacteria bacterium]|jgi:Xaa-Pro aminopeptidase